MIGAVILAAGASRRFGDENKLLALIGGRPIIRGVAEVMSAGGVGDLVVVTGCDGGAVGASLTGTPARLVHNDAWSVGMGTSIAAGVSALDPGTEGAFIVPGDMPCLEAWAVMRLVAAFREHGGRHVVVPRTNAGSQRNPVLWPRELFPRLARLTGEQGGKAVLASLPAGRCVDVPFDDEALFRDVDTARDYAALQQGAAS